MASPLITHMMPNSRVKQNDEREKDCTPRRVSNFPTASASCYLPRLPLLEQTLSIHLGKE